MTEQKPRNGIHSITIRRPDDFHVHFRDGEVLGVVAPLTARQFARALVMPNLTPPIRNVADAAAYRHRILAVMPADSSFSPIMTLYLTDQTSPDDIRSAHASGFIKACKLYPAGATTNSAHGITKYENVYPALAAMQESGMILCVHGESTGAEVDIFDREAEFLRLTLPNILREFPTLKIVLEHVTTADAVKAVQATVGTRLAATITAHHLLYSRQALFKNSKLHPHMFCLPVLKRETHRQALLDAIRTNTNGKFFAGTDSAPHILSSKHCAEGCAGIFTGHSAVELYTEAFDEAGALDKLEPFLSEYGAKFYGLPLNDGKITIRKTAHSIPAKLVVPNSEPIIPICAGDTLPWSAEESSS